MTVLNRSWQQLAITTGSNDKYVGLYAYCTQDIATNTSTVVIHLDAGVLSSGHSWSVDSWSASCSGGGSGSGGYTKWTTGGNTVAEGRLRVNHDGSGNASVNISATFRSTYGITNWNPSVTVQLPNIPRSSGLSVSNSSVNVGGYQTFNINSHSSSFRYNLYLDRNNGYVDVNNRIANRISQTSYRWQVPWTAFDREPLSTKSMTVYAHCYTYASADGEQVGNPSVTSFTINAIEPDLTVQSSTIKTGETQILYINKKVSNLSADIYLSIENGQKQLVSSRNSSTSYSYRVPDSIFSQYPSLTSLNAKFYIQTYNGSSRVGRETSVSFQITSGGGMTPQFSSGINVYEENSYIRNISNSITIQNISEKSVSCTITPQYGATIQSVVVSNGNVSQAMTRGYGNTWNTTRNLTGMTSGEYVVTATDSRGIVSSYVAPTQTYYNYSLPSIQKNDLKRFSEIGDTGEHVLEVSYTNILSNYVTVNCSFTSSAYYSGGPSDSYTTNGGMKVLTRRQNVYGLTYNQNHTVNVTVTDRFGKTVTSSSDSAVGKPSLWIGKTKVAINGQLYINDQLVDPKPPKVEVFPVGSIYLSVNSYNPSRYFGGYWAQIAQGRTLIGAGSGTDNNGNRMSFYGGDTGGEYKHTLTSPEIPSHTHGLGYNNRFLGNGSGNESAGLNVNGNAYALHNQTSATGGNQSHNNVQPYLVVYIWQRTA